MFNRYRRQLGGFGPAGPFGFHNGEMRRLERARRRRERAKRTTRWVARRSWTHRRGLAPGYAAAAMLGLGAVGQYTPHGAPLVLTLWVWVGCALAWWLTRRGRRAMVRRWRRLVYIAATYMTAAAWLLAATVAGLTPPVRAALILWAGAAGIPWWWHHRIRQHVQVDVDEDERVTDWRDFVAAQGGPGAGSDLAELEDTEYGWRGVATVPRGKRASGLIAGAEEVASAFDRDSVADVALEQVSARRVSVTVYERNPLTEVIHWPGPHLFDAGRGVSQIGTYADGGPAMYRWYKRGSGPVHDLIAGTTDGGKSRCVDQLLAIERACPFMASVVIDPQQGQSLPEWKRQVAVFARGVDEGIDVLDAVFLEMKRRERILSSLEWTDEMGRQHEGIDHFDPLNPVIRGFGLPMICVTIEEAPEMLRVAGAAAVVEAIGRQSRKCGIKLRLVVQVPLLDQLGGSTTLRAMVAAGNVIVLRTSDRLSGQVAFNGVLPVDPALLPREWPDGSTTAGLGFILGPGARSVPMRLNLVDDPYHWAHEGETMILPSVVVYLDTVRGTKPAQEAGPDDRPEGLRAVAAVKAGTIADRALAWLARQESDRATTGTIATAIDELLPSVSQALSRAAKAGRVIDLGYAMWGRLEPADEMAGVA